ncbi:UNVERIFIED_CONTAM: hypothetical protein Sradi_1976500 [Sesamum radiatum]|uniref:Uncharacterized protein n=1 Tax=Sesamum radiatum TaxID=300843 RepID=A0AAW2TGB7_SESRA
MATAVAPVSVSGGHRTKNCGLVSVNSSAFVKTQMLTIQRKMPTRANRNLSLRAQYDDRSGGSGADFVAGFLLGGAVFGTLAYIFAPQIRRSLLNEDEYGFRRAKRPIYYDEGLEVTMILAAFSSCIFFCLHQLPLTILTHPNTFLFHLIFDIQKTRQTLNEKISQLNSAIDNVSSRLRGGNNLPQVPVEIDPEEAAL